ncbi:MAG: hypothetical protein HYY92_01045 [Parcubacteria group bacterium]|nr:hypothetical protein [Parcubacteria group bacterium]
MLCGNFEVFPGSTWLAELAVTLLGGEHIDAGNWTTMPVRLKNIGIEDALAFMELARERNHSIKMRLEHYTVSVSTSCHNQPCVEVFGAPPEVMKALTVAMRENRVGEKAYETKCAAGAFLQGQDVADGWMLIEFWQPNYAPFVDYLNERLKELKPSGD